MELKQIEYFCAAAEIEHVTHAAETLMVSQPYLTKMIRQLETELGVSLFDHVGRRIKLNEYGKIYYEYAKTILETLSNAKDEVDELKGKKLTTLSLFTNVSLYMPGLLGAFHRENPGLSLTQLSARRERIIEALLSGEADYAVCSPPIDEQNIETQILFKETIYVMLPSDHPLRRKKSLLLKDLNDENFVITPIGYGMRDNQNRIFADRDVHPRIVIETADTSLMPSYVSEGVGIAMLPGFVVINNKSLAKDCWVINDLNYEGFVSLSWKKSSYKTKVHQLLMDFIVDYYSNHVEPLCQSILDHDENEIAPL